MATKLLQRSRGARELARLGLTHEAVALRIGRSRSLVGHWVAGRRTPSDPDRQKLAELGIRPEWWDETRPTKPSKPKASGRKRAKKPAEPLPSVASKLAPGAKGVDWSSVLEERAQRLLRLCDKLIEDANKELAADDDDDFDPLTRMERAKVAASATTTLEKLGRITGEVLQISEVRLLRTPAWRRIEALIVTALQPHPEALHAVGVALQQL